MSEPTSTPPASSTTTPPGAYPEHDKLGPLATGGDGVGWRATLLGAARAAVADGRTAAAQLGTAPAEAVHGVRKALRRMRAYAALAAAALPAGIDDLIENVRIARRDLAHARDLEVAPAAIAELPLADADRAAATALVTSVRATAPAAADLAAGIARAVTALAAVGDALDAALPADIDDAVIIKGAVGTYRDARRERRRAKGSRRAMHRWRRRSKELAHQLALIASTAGERTRTVATGFDSLADDLGPIVDLLVVRDLARAATEPLELGGVKAAVEGLYGDAVRGARRASRDAFAGGGRRFGRRLARRIAKDRGAHDTQVAGEPT